MRIILAILLATSPTQHHNAPAQPGLAAQSWSTTPGIVHVEQLRPVPVKLCQDGPTMSVTTHGRNMTIEGGRLCRPDEAPTLVIDPGACNILDGTVTGTLIMDCSSRR